MPFKRMAKSIFGSTKDINVKEAHAKLLASLDNEKQKGNPAKSGKLC